VEVLLGGLAECIEALSLKDLYQKITARPQYAGCHVECQFDEKHGTRLVDSPGSTHVGGHVGDYKVYALIAYDFKQLCEHGLFSKVTFYEGDAWE
jgi:hypothetical protein